MTAPEFVCARLAACTQPICSSTTCKCRPCTCNACIARRRHVEHRADQAERVVAARRLRNQEAIAR